MTTTRVTSDGEVLSLLDGLRDGVRVQVILRAVGRLGIERIGGPWRSESEAQAELAKLAEACDSGATLVLDWAVIRGPRIVAAHLERQADRGKRPKFGSAGPFG